MTLSALLFIIATSFLAGMGTASALWSLTDNIAAKRIRAINERRAKDRGAA